MSEAGRPAGPGAGDAEEASASGRHRLRHRKRRRPSIVVPSWRWWQLLAAVGVSLLAGAITILLLHGSPLP